MFLISEDIPFFAVPSAAVSGKGNFAVGGNASFLPSLQHKRKKRGTTLNPVCWYLCLRMPFTAVVVPMLVLLPAELKHKEVNCFHMLVSLLSYMCTPLSCQEEEDFPLV